MWTPSPNHREGGRSVTLFRINRPQAEGTVGYCCPSRTLSPEPAESPSVASSRFFSPVSKVPGSSCLSFSLDAHPGISSFHNTYLLQVPTCPPLSLLRLCRFCPFCQICPFSTVSAYLQVSGQVTSAGAPLWTHLAGFRDNFSTVTVVFIQFNQ